MLEPSASSRPSAIAADRPRAQRRRFGRISLKPDGSLRSRKSKQSDYVSRAGPKPTARITQRAEPKVV